MTEHSAAGDFEQVNTGRSSQMVYEDLSERIIRGEYLTGEKLPSEKELMLRYDRSHGTVRDGIKMLQAMGMVRIRRGRSHKFHRYVLQNSRRDLRFFPHIHGTDN